MSYDDGRWQRAGISGQARRSFEEWKINLGDATRWHQMGVTDGLTATRWQIAGVAPAEVAGWTAAGIDSVEALHWCQLGHDLDYAKRQKASGLGPGQSSSGSRQWGRTAWASATVSSGPNATGSAFQHWLNSGSPQSHVVHFYLMAGWTSDEALPWAKAEILPDTARVWATLGVRPREAARLERAGTCAVDVVREWWAAGIPLDQVAAWLGAGLTPAEAAEQLAAGVTPDQASVMRALRDDEGED